VVSLATLRPHLYAALAREISPEGWVVGMKKTVKLFQPHHLLAYRKLDAAMPPYRSPTPEHHISDVYALVPAVERRRSYRRGTLPLRRHPASGTSTRRTSWWPGSSRHAMASWSSSIPMPRPKTLLAAGARGCTDPGHAGAAGLGRGLLHRQRRSPGAGPCTRSDRPLWPAAHAALQREENFFQLPAMLACCDLIISVETAVMHLANAVQVPVIALMRQKNPEWVPVDRDHSTVITAPGRRDWVKAVSVEQVMKAI
jgi:hypothetical protein